VEPWQKKLCNCVWDSNWFIGFQLFCFKDIKAILCSTHQHSRPLVERRTSGGNFIFAKTSKQKLCHARPPALQTKPTRGSRKASNKVHVNFGVSGPTVCSTSKTMLSYAQKIRCDMLQF
jgi:hypothetical protein